MQSRIGLATAMVLLIGLGTFQAEATEYRGDGIEVATRQSLIHLGSLDSFDITPSGKRAAQHLLDALNHKDPASARAAIAIYKEIIPNENFGGEYTTLQWLCEYLTASKKEQNLMLQDKIVANFYHFLAQDDFARLKLFLTQKYHLEEYAHKAISKTEKDYRFMEDFLLFANPRRESWEKSSKIMSVLNLKKGDKVADIGSGPGYYTFKFAKIVGKTGRVYARDNDLLHNEYVSKLAKKLGITNIQVAAPDFANINVPEKVDWVFMCSLYHIIYAMMAESQKEGFIGSIRNALKPKGTFVVVDNDLVYDRTLPYHGPYIDRDLVITQLKHYGLKLVATHQFIPQRYVLMFQLDPNYEPLPHQTSKPAPKPFPAQGIVVRYPEKLPPTPGVCHLDALDPERITVTSKTSLVRFPGAEAFPGFTKEGRAAARQFLQALQSKDRTALQQTIDAYDQIIPKQRYGDEYTAFRWFCEYLLASAEQRQGMLQDKTTKAYFDYLAADDFAVLKKYVKNRYFLEELGTEIDKQLQAQANAPGNQPKEPPKEVKRNVSMDQLMHWGEFITFDNPAREVWEKTTKILDFIGIKPGQAIADIGSGPGYYTFKFAKLVGEEGRVYALDTDQKYLDYVSSVANKCGFKNITAVHSKGNDISMPANSIDAAFLCSLYHVIYMTDMEYVKDEFMQSIRKSLKKDGKLIIVDNSLLPESLNPYYGPGIAKELIITQLKHYGFALVAYGQFIAQRYVLIFRKLELPQAS